MCVSVRLCVEPEAILSSGGDGGSREAAPGQQTPEPSQHSAHPHGETNSLILSVLRS